MASQGFEVGRPSPLAVELARIVERGIRECRALDTEALAIVAGEKVWAITCTLHVVDHGGNLVDCVSLAAIAALLHYRRPEVAVQGNATLVYSADEHAAVPLSLHHLPISISFCFLERRDTADDNGDGGSPVIFMDPTDREERVTDGTMTFTFNSFRELCAVHKIGGAAIAASDVLRCAAVAAARASELTDFLKAEADKADAEAVARRRALLRGRDFADVSSLSTTATAAQSRAPVDLGAMTDFATLHAPIALRDDPTAAEADAQVTSMAQLLASLETAADAAETSGDSGDGLALTAAARDAFTKLTESASLRALVAGAKGTTTAAAAATEAPRTQVTNVTTTTTTKATTQQKTKTKAKAADSDSEEESVVVQSEFGGAAVAPVAKATKKPAKKATTKKKQAAVSSDDDSAEEQDLSAAIKRKPRKGPASACEASDGARERDDRRGLADDARVTEIGGGGACELQLSPVGRLSATLLRERECGAGDAQARARVRAGASEREGACWRRGGELARAGGGGGAAAADVVESVLDGYNGTVMAYGQTGAGKTFTMSGGKQSFQDRGVCARALSAIFQRVQRDAEHAYAVRVSYVEVYNESLYDLLNFSEPHGAGPSHSFGSNNSSSSAARDELAIQENAKGQTFIKGLARPLVKSEEEAFDLLFQGETNRTIAEHCLNAASTRSHCIFTVYVERRRSATGGMLLVSDDDQDVSTLHAPAVTAAVVNVVLSGGAAATAGGGGGDAATRQALAACTQEIASLKAELALYDTLNGRSHVDYDTRAAASPARQALCRELVLRFVRDSSAPALPLDSVLQIQQLFGAFRTVCVEQQARIEALRREVETLQRRRTGTGPESTGTGESNKVAQIRALRARSPPDATADERTTTRTPLGGCRQQGVKLPLVARNATLLPLLKAAETPECDDDDDVGDEPQRARRHPSPRLPLLAPQHLRADDGGSHSSSRNSVPSDKELFDRFRKRESPTPASVLDVDLAKQNLRQAKAQLAACGLEVNRLKLCVSLRPGHCVVL
ncbi:hypothetical protein PybrP1_008455, partial [[Pythium] brassicae (nom. inval.)]